MCPWMWSCFCCSLSLCQANTSRSSLLQAYKALTIARELSGADFEIFRLVDALKECEKFELAERTLDILDSEYILKGGGT